MCHDDTLEVNLIEKDPEKVLLFQDDDGFSIDISAAYVLGFVSVEKYMTATEEERFYHLSQSEFEIIKRNYTIVYAARSNGNQMTSNR